MVESKHAASGLPRHDFLVVLGLTLPVSINDVKQAYLDKAKLAHPDHGGTIEQFIRLQAAFEQATEYASFKQGRMQWLSRWVEQYAEQQQLVDQIKAWGGTTDVKSCDWLTESIGQDFATVLDQLTVIRLSGPRIDDGVMVQLGMQRRMLAGLQRLELIETRVSSVGLRQLHHTDSLRHLDLSGTRVGVRALAALLDDLPALESIVLRDTGISWWARQKLRWSHRTLIVSS